MIKPTKHNPPLTHSDTKVQVSKLPTDKELKDKASKS